MNRSENILLISKDDFDMIYHPCCECGNFADDGGLRNGQFTCHECLDNVKAERNQDEFKTPKHIRRG